MQRAWSSYSLSTTWYNNTLCAEVTNVQVVISATYTSWQGGSCHTVLLLTWANPPGVHVIVCLALMERGGLCLAHDTDGSVTKEYNGHVGISFPPCFSKVAVEDSGNQSGAVWGSAELDIIRIATIGTQLNPDIVTVKVSRRYIQDTWITFKNFFAEKQLYNELRDTVVKPAVIGANYYAVTTDLWTSSFYEFYNAFYWWYNWQLKTFCLDTVPVLDDHTGQYLADAVQDILGNLELDSANLICATTDNGSNFVAPFTIPNWTKLSCLDTIWTFVSIKPFI